MLDVHSLIYNNKKIEKTASLVPGSNHPRVAPVPHVKHYKTYTSCCWDRK